MRKILGVILTVTGLLVFGQAKSQTIEVGQDATQIKTLIEWSTKDHNKPDSYGNTSNSYWTWDVKYYDGQIEDVIQCYQDQYLIDFRVIANYCKHYVMENGKLAYVLTQFDNISLEKLKEFYSDNYSADKIGELYFSDDLEHYTKIYLANNGLATKEWRKTIIPELPSNIQQSVKTKLTTIRTETKTKQKEESTAKLTKEEADSKERQYTILTCDNFSNGLALVGIDTEHKAGEMNYGYGKRMFGYINDGGEYVIYPKYEKAFSFIDGFALVTTNTRYTNNWEFINKDGLNIINKNFADARNFSEGFAAVRMKNGNYGFIDKTGEFISDPIYQEVGDFSEGFARVKFQKKWGYIDKTGKEKIYPQFSTAYDFSEGYAAVSKFVDYHYTEYGFININGQYLIKSAVNAGSAFKILTDYKEGFAKISKGYQSNGYGAFYYQGFGIVSLEGKKKFKSGFKELSSFSENIALAQKSVGHKYGYVNEKLKWIISPIFDDAGHFSEGLARVKINSNWGFIDKTGNIVINKNIASSKTALQTNAPFDDVSDFSDGLAIVKTRNKLGYIDKTGNWIIKPELVGAKPFKNGIARVKFSDRKGWNFIDKNGKVLFENFL